MLKRNLLLLGGACALLRAADSGLPAGGSPDAPEDKPEEKPEPPEVEPEIAGTTIEAKFESARGHVSALFARVSALAGQVKAALAAAAKSAEQFEAATVEVSAARAQAETLRGELAAVRQDRDNQTTRAATAEGHVERLEKLCALRGTSPEEAISQPPPPAPDERKALVAKLDAAASPEDRGRIAAELRNFDAAAAAKKAKA